MSDRQHVAFFKLADDMAQLRAVGARLSLLKNLSDLGIGLPMKIATDDF